MDPQKIKLKIDMTALLENDVANKYYLPEKGFRRTVE